MKKHLLSSLASAFVLLSTPLLAQTLEEGTWGGSMTIPGEPEMQVRYEVRKEEGELSITIVGGHNRLRTHSVQLDGKTLSFSWGEGPSTDCVLELQTDAGYRGACSRDGGPKGEIEMNPPAAAGTAEDEPPDSP